jgi:GTPase
MDLDLFLDDLLAKPIKILPEFDHEILVNFSEAIIAECKYNGIHFTILSDKILLRKSNPHELQIAVVGNVDAGKSTILGVLTNGKLDDGRGLARSTVLRFKHEKETGRTSSIFTKYMGFSIDGKPIYEDVQETLKEVYLHNNAYKMISFVDLAGHRKYLRTTIFGLTSYNPNYTMVIVGANNGLIGSAKEHIGICLALGIKFFIVITKIDMCPENVLKDTIALIKKILKTKGCEMKSFYIKDINDVISAISSIDSKVCPIFKMSSKSGKNLDLLIDFLNLLPSNHKQSLDKNVKFMINEIYNVRGIGGVASGILKSGQINVKDKLLFGPDKSGEFIEVFVKSIEKHRVKIPTVNFNECVTIAFGVKSSDIRKGQVLINTEPLVTLTFRAKIVVLHHSTSITVGYKSFLVCESIRQECAIINIEDKEILRIGDTAIVTIKMCKYGEYLTVGSKFILREMTAKIIGTII